MTTAPPLRSASLAARTFAFTPSSNEGKRYYGERERERRGGRGKTTIIPRVSNQIDEMIDACAPYWTARIMGNSFLFSRRCCEQRLIPIDLLVITRRLWDEGKKNERRIPFSFFDIVEFEYRPLDLAQFISFVEDFFSFYFILFSLLLFVHPLMYLQPYCALTRR